MPRPLILNGVPPSLAKDAWWLSATPEDAASSPASQTRSGRLPRTLSVIVLVLLADVLFWEADVGLSAALYTAVIFVIVVLETPVRRWQRPAALVALAALPVAHDVQPLSVVFLIAGLVAALVWVRHPDALGDAIVRSTARFIARLPLEWAIRLNPSRAVSVTGNVGHFRRYMKDWGFPLGGGILILALLMQANPVLSGFLTPDLDLSEAVRRALFWAGIALMIAPFLSPVPISTATFSSRPAVPGLGLHAGSVLRALVVFNLLIALQTLTDVTILLGGAALPPGMTLAEFAHRGAYPLLATAILAGGFALAARPFLGSTRAIRPLLLLWLAQNVVLCAAAALRLELYIEGFSLTYLRLYALIWMAVVAAGLVLIFWQVLRDRPNTWLLARSFVLGTGILYACCFVNFAQVIAAHNVRQADPDRIYLCTLGPLAAGPILDSKFGTVRAGRLDLGPCSMTLPETGDWREWGFRTWAASRYVQRVATAESPH